MVALQVSSDHLEAFEVILRAYSRIGETLPRFRLLGEVFRDKKEFHQVLAVFYSDILHFHGQAYKFVRRSGRLFCDCPTSKLLKVPRKSVRGLRTLY